ncbi:site-specific DNA-methyltransferase [Micromonospora sp. WMMD1102]|uniref:DNA-methyltransferase n=1 Tax=Micromonospora sp. WMMD1102 TaxID=3016105 RepID=UPI002415571E|nr:site-specific DNA-methyltransferase [Micromonospora sp. WMMD1102]MDG4791983.1 site-specific DNA-methyltransferase [Micromonospora sp. WMMD1102]
MITPYWSDDMVTLYHGDCRDILPQLDLRADCAVADPPYEETLLGWDRWPTGWLEAVAAVTDSMWCFLPLRQFAEPPYRGQEFRAAGWKLSHDVEPDWNSQHDHVTWEKHNGSGFVKDRFRRVHEPASHWYRGKWSAVHHEVPRVPAVHRRGGQNFVRQQPAHTGAVAGRGYADDGLRLMRSVLHVRNVNGRAIHPTEKPVPLLEPLIRYGCPPGGLVVDPCAGSCSTGVAARLAGCRSILIEGDEAMCEKAVTHRLSRVDAGVPDNVLGGQGDVPDLFSLGGAA